MREIIFSNFINGKIFARYYSSSKITYELPAWRDFEDIFTIIFRPMMIISDTDCKIKIAF